MRTNFQICLHEGPPINPDARLRNSRYDYNADKMDGFDKKDFIDKKDGVDKGGVVVGEKWGGVGGDDEKDEDGDHINYRCGATRSEPTFLHRHTIETQ